MSSDVSDIDASFKRVRNRPDMCDMSRTEFRGDHIATDGNLYFLYRNLNFGRRGSPAYFPITGRGIALGRRNFSPTNKPRGGHQEFPSILVARAAIPIAPNVRLRPEVCVSRLVNIIRESLGDDSRNQDKHGGEGERKHTHILSAHAENAGELAARLPDAKVCGAWGVLRGPVFNPGNRIAPVEISKSYEDLSIDGRAQAGSGNIWIPYLMLY